MMPLVGRKSRRFRIDVTGEKGGGNRSMENSAELASLIDRVSKLERQNRGGKILLLVLLMVVLVAAVSGQSPTSKSKVIEAQEFVVRDGKGKLRAKLYLDDTGPVLAFYDA